MAKALFEVHIAKYDTEMLTMRPTLTIPRLVGVFCFRFFAGFVDWQVTEPRWS